MERRGVPTVVVCTEPFLGLARGIAKSQGSSHLRVVTVPHPLGSLSPEAVRERAERVLEDMIGAVLTPFPAAEAGAIEEQLIAGQPRGIEVSKGDEELDDILYRLGWTDGLPVQAPTEGRVARLVAATNEPADVVIGTVPPLNGRATVEKIAINAALTGCLPEHMPVLLAAVRAMLDPSFELRGVQATTGPHGVLVLVNGPVARELSLNGGTNAFGPGSLSNARIGRAIRLILLNLGGAIPGAADKSTQGNPSKYGYCVAENEEASPWEPFHVSRGFRREESVVTVFAAQGPVNIHDTVSTTPEGVLTTAVDTMSTLGGSKLYQSFSQSLVALSPEHASIIAGAGWTRRHVQQYIVDNAHRPMRDARRGGWFGRSLHWPDWVDPNDDDALAPLHVRPEDVLLVVVGGLGRHSSYMQLWHRSQAISVAVG